MKAILDWLKSRAADDLLPWDIQLEAADKFDLGPNEVERLALESGLLPARYQRNRHMISTEQQLQLFKSKVCIIGCGGLGGYIIEELARLGVGRLVTIDPDVFEEHNLNRQILSSLKALGEPKAEKAAERVAEINPAVTVHPLQAAFKKQNGASMLSGTDVVVDATDNIPVRLELAQCCNELEIPLVHGAIAGWYGHVTSILPGEDTMQKIYGHWVESHALERQLGNPSFTPAVVASLQVAEVCKILLDAGSLLRSRKLSINLLDMEVEEVAL